MRQDAQFDLRIIRHDQLAARRRDEGTADFPTSRGTDRNVLKVRVRRGEPARRRDRLAQRRVHAAFRVGKRGKRVHVRPFQLRDLSVFEHQTWHREALLRELGQNVEAGRRGLRLRGLLSGGVAQFLKEDLAELDGRIQIELLSGLLPDLLLQGAQVLLHARRHLSQEGHVDCDASDLHAGQHRGQRPLDLAIDLLQGRTLRELGLQSQGELPGPRGPLGQPAVGGVDRISLRERAGDDPRFLVRRDPLAEALEGHGFELRSSDARRENVLGEAGVEDVPSNGAARAGEQRFQRLCVGERDLPARAVERLPARQDLALGFFRDLDAAIARDSQEDPVASAQERGAERLLRSHREGGAGRDAGSLNLGRRGGLRAQLGREGMELELDEQLLQARRVRLGAFERRRLERDRQVRRDRDETAGQDRRLPVLPETLADFALDLIGLREQRVQVAIGGDPFLGRDLAHARHPRHVVHAVSHERQDVGDLLRPDPEEFLDARLVQELLAPRVVDADAGRNELEHVLVRRNDDDLEALCRRLLRQRSDDIVRLVARKLQDRDAVRVEHPADVSDLRRQVRGHRQPVRLVLGVCLMPHRPLRAVPGDREVVGGVLAQHLAQHRHEAVDRVGRLSGRGREAGDRVIGAMDVGHRVHQVQFRAVRRHRMDSMRESDRTGRLRIALPAPGANRQKSGCFRGESPRLRPARPRGHGLPNRGTFARSGD